MGSATRSIREWSIVVVTLAVAGYTLSSYVVSGQARQASSIASISEVATVDGSNFGWNAQLSAGKAPAFSAQARSNVVRENGLVTNYEQRPIQLAQYRGQVVFLNFWSTTCAPCLKEIPDLGKLSENMAGLPFVILAVSTDKAWSDVDAKLPNLPKGIKVALDPSGGEIKRSFGTDKIPESYVIDKKGNLRMRFVNVHPWGDERIHRYLETLANE